LAPEPFTRSRPEKKSQQSAPTERRILPMQLQIGDRLIDETGEWEVIGRPYTTAGGKDARVAFTGWTGSPATPRSGSGERTSASA